MLKVYVDTGLDILEVANFSSGYEVVGGIEGSFFQFFSQAMRVPIYIIPFLDGVNSPDEFLKPIETNDADIGIGRMYTKYDRLGKRIPSLPYAYGDYRFITKPPMPISKKYVFIDPFDINVWLSVLTIFIVMPIILRILLSTKHSLVKLYFNVLSDFLRQSKDISVFSSSKDRILLAWWYLGCSLISYFYLSVILSFLMMPRKEGSVDTFAQLTRLVLQGKYKCSTLRYSAFENYFKLSPDGNLRKLGALIEENDWRIDGTVESVLKSVIQDGIAVFLPTFMWQHQIKGVTVSKDSVYQGPMGMYMSRKFCCPEKINLFSTHVAESGIYDKMLSDYFFKKNLKNSYLKLANLNTDHAIPLSFHELIGAFNLYIIGIVLSSFLFLIEISFKCCH